MPNPSRQRWVNVIDVASTKRLFSSLTRRGPHRVLRGDLAFAGIPGIVYTPQSGFNLPAVAFCHDWITRADRYAGTLEHLASWGIVAAAPDTERGLAPSVLNLAYDLGTTLDILTGVRLGEGNISVHPAKLATAGHGFGGSAAVFAAAGAPARVAAVCALFPSVTSPRAEEAAPGLVAAGKPGLILTDPGDPMTLRSNAAELGKVWTTATLRAVTKGKAGGLVEGRTLAKAVGLPGGNRSTQKTVRALLTGFLLATLRPDLKKNNPYRDFADPEAILPRTELADLTEDPVDMENKVVALLKP